MMLSDIFSSWSGDLSKIFDQNVTKTSERVGDYYIVNIALPEQTYRICFPVSACTEAELTNYLLSGMYLPDWEYKLISRSMKCAKEM